MNKMQSIMTSFGIAPPPEDRRREPRYASDGVCEVTLLSQSPVSLEGRVMDASRSGLRVEVPCQVGAGSRLRVRLRETIVFATVRWSRWSRENFWEAGVEIDHTISRSLVDSLRNGARAAACVEPKVS